MSRRNAETPNQLYNFNQLSKVKIKPDSLSSFYFHDINPGMSDELKVIQQITGILENLPVNYMITGSIALNYYATPRMTRDIDIVIELPEKDISKLATQLADDFYFDPDTALEATRSHSMFNAIHNHLMVKVDFICRKDAEYRKVEFERRKRVDIGGMSIWMVAIEDLVLSKLSWAKDGESHKQLNDVIELLKDSTAYDKIYLKRWAKELHLESLLAEAFP